MAQQIRARRTALHEPEVMVVVRGARVTCALGQSELTHDRDHDLWRWTPVRAAGMP
jgi:hypothetical protein